MKKEEIDLLNKMIIFYWQNNNIPNNQEEWFVSQEIIKQLILPVVIGNIGKSTKPTLTELTADQLENGMNPCQLCRYKQKDYHSDECRKCRNENKSRQYYL